MSDETPIEDPELPEEPGEDAAEGDNVPVTYSHTVSVPGETWATERERVERTAIGGAISAALDAGYRHLRVTDVSNEVLRIELHDGTVLEGQVIVTAHVDAS